MPEIYEKVFISYAKEDHDVAFRLYQDLRGRNISAWFDKEELEPGCNWKTEIKKAIKSCKYFIAVISKKSVSKRGFVQYELCEAVEVLNEVPENQIYLIPVRIDDCSPSMYRLRERHWVDMFPSWNEGIDNICKVIKPPIQEIFRIDPKSSRIIWGARPKKHEDLINKNLKRFIDGDKWGHVVKIWASSKNSEGKKKIQAAVPFILNSIEDPNWNKVIYFPSNIKIVDNQNIEIYISR